MNIEKPFNILVCGNNFDAVSKFIENLDYNNLSKDSEEGFCREFKVKGTTVRIFKGIYPLYNDKMHAVIIVYSKFCKEFSEIVMEMYKNVVIEAIIINNSESPKWDPIPSIIEKVYNFKEE